jgi:hypothetical protein
LLRWAGAVSRYWSISELRERGRAASLGWITDLNQRLRKHKVRFAVGGPGVGYSSTWSALQAADSSFYILARDLKNTTKISLHPLNGKPYGNCRLAFDDKHYRWLGEQGHVRPDDRTFLKWKWPPAPATDAACAVILVFPTDRLTLGHPGGTRSKLLFILEPAPAGMAVEVGFFYSCEPVETLDAKFLTIGFPVFRWDLPDGESVSMVARHAPYQRPVLAPTGVQVIAPDFPLGIEQTGLHAIMWNAPADGEPLRVTEVGDAKVRNG